MTQTVPASAKRAARIIAVSQTCKREIEQYIPGSKGKVAAIYNGLPPWVVRDPNPAPALRELGVSTSYLLTVGTQWPRKNMGLAIEAANLAEFPIVVTGKPGWGKKSELGHVKRVGYVSNQQLCSLYSGASLYLAPSLHEGFGIPLIEAFACGCPVLCSSGGALPEVAGDAAVVEPSWKAEVWAERIASLLGDSGNLSRMRERGLERVKQFDWVESARQTLDVYKEVAR